MAGDARALFLGMQSPVGSSRHSERERTGRGVCHFTLRGVFTCSLLFRPLCFRPTGIDDGVGAGMYRGEAEHGRLAFEPMAGAALATCVISISGVTVVDDWTLQPNPTSLPTGVPGPCRCGESCAPGLTIHRAAIADRMHLFASLLRVGIVGRRLPDEGDPDSAHSVRSETSRVVFPATRRERIGVSTDITLCRSVPLIAGIAGIHASRTSIPHARRQPFGQMA